MKAKFELNKEALLGLYYENKELSVPIFAILVSLILFLIFILPQLLSFPSRKSAVDSENAILEKLKESEKILSISNVELINSQAEMAAKVLPENKPIEAALDAVFTAASLSNSQIESYQFAETTEAKSQDAEASETPEETNKYQSLDFSVNIFGDLNQAVDFIDQLYKSYPISSVESVSVSEGIVSISISFYYSPFISGTLTDRTNVKAMSEEEKKTIEEIQTWNESLGGDIFSLTQESTSSAGSSSSPF